MSLPCCYTPFNRAPMCTEKNPNSSALRSKSSLIWPQLTPCGTSHFSLLSQGDAHHSPLALPCSCGSLCLGISSSHRRGCKLMPPLRHSSASAERPQHLVTTFTLAHLLSCTNVCFHILSPLWDHLIHQEQRSRLGHLSVPVPNTWPCT